MQRSTLLLEEDALALQKALAQLRSATLREREKDAIIAAQSLETAVAAAEVRRCGLELGAATSEASILRLETIPHNLSVHVAHFSLQANWRAKLKQLQQLAADTAALLTLLVKYAGLDRGAFSYKAMWGIIRPLLRVLLWVLPEHVPDAPADRRKGTSTATQGQWVDTGAAYVEAMITVIDLCAWLEAYQCIAAFPSYPSSGSEVSRCQQQLSLLFKGLLLQIVPYLAPFFTHIPHRTKLTWLCWG
jgi:hypothetical protein